jgi:hypothetical protein
VLTGIAYWDGWAQVAFGNLMTTGGAQHKRAKLKQDVQALKSKCKAAAMQTIQQLRSQVRLLSILILRHFYYSYLVLRLMLRDCRNANHPTTALTGIILY